MDWHPQMSTLINADNSNCRYTVLRPRFSTQVLGEDARLIGYQSSAILPNNSPVRIAQGQIQRTRALAQASASLEACKQLHQVSFAGLLLCRGLALHVHKQAGLVWLASGDPVRWQLGYTLSSRMIDIEL